MQDTIELFYFCEIHHGKVVSYAIFIDEPCGYFLPIIVNKEKAKIFEVIFRDKGYESLDNLIPIYLFIL